MVTEREIKGMNALKKVGYTNTEVANMFNVSPYVVKYNTNASFKARKQASNRVSRAK